MYGSRIINMLQSFVRVLLWAFLLAIRPTDCIEYCNDREGGGICPTGNTCCRYDDSNFPHSSSGCIPNDLGSFNASCCYFNRSATSGCPVGYICLEESERSSFGTKAACCAIPALSMAGESQRQSASVPDPLLTVLPRYPLYPCPQIRHVYGFSIHQKQVNDSTSLDSVHVRESSNTRIRREAKMAYYSSHGNIQGDDIASWRQDIRQVVFMIHGANRNADDYFCATQSILFHTSNSAQNFSPLISPKSVLIVVPWFASTLDDEISLQNGGVALRWNGSDVSGTWRYGANAVFPSCIRRLYFTYSSFSVFDRMISFVLGDYGLEDKNDRQKRFPNLQRVVVAGHSSGGQFVQRWSLLTSIWDRRRMKSVVANPSSYAYLMSLRNIHGEWITPKKDLCFNYDQWEWGIGVLDNFSLPFEWESAQDVPPYVQSALSRYGSVQNLTKSFALRDITYLAGGLDVCNIPDRLGPNGWCNSHGLETTCSDMLQGSNRLERHHWYCSSLHLLNISHRCYVVPGVGHDHSLMFSSNIGTASLFGPDGTDDIAVNL